MPESLDTLLRGFREGRGHEVWPDFLEACGGLLLQVARHVIHDEDDAADAFVFVCERLAADDFARLQRFDPDGPGQPATWLRVVARNLCLDHYRSRHGRFRVFEAIARMPVLEQLVFRRRFRDGLSLHETLASLRQERPQLTLEAVSAAAQRVTVAMGSRQLWALSAARPRIESLDAEARDCRGLSDPESLEPSPEEVLGSLEQRERLRKAVARLLPEERLMVRLRIEQNLTLAEVARVTGLKDPQRADRRLRAIYRRLRDELG